MSKAINEPQSTNRLNLEQNDTLLQEMTVNLIENIPSHRPAEGRLANVYTELWDFLEKIGILPLEPNLREEMLKTRFIYVVDLHDISQFCFPYGFDLPNRKPNRIPPLEEVYDQMFAWREFFKDTQITHLLMNEHLPELRGLKFQAQKSRDAVGAMRKLAKQIKSVNKQYEIDSSSQNSTSQELAELLIKRPNYFIAIVVGLLGEGMKRLAEIAGAKLVIGSQRLRRNFEGIESEEDIDRIESIFESTLAGILADELYTEAVKSLTKDENSRSRLDNLYIDCQVIDRILNINKKLYSEFKNRNIKHRYVLLFLSSTDTVKNFSNYSRFQQNLLPLGPYRKHNITRNVSQLYANSLFQYSLKSQTDSADSQKQLSGQELAFRQLDELRILRQIIERRTDESFDITENHRSLSADLRNQYETFAMLKNLETWRSDFNQNIGKLENLSINGELSSEAINKILVSVKRLVEEAQTNNVFQELPVTIAALRSVDFNETYTEKLRNALKAWQMQDKGHNFHLPTNSKDAVVGVNHRLPILLQLDGNVVEETKIILAKIVDIVLNHDRAQSYYKDIEKFLLTIPTRYTFDSIYTTDSFHKRYLIRAYDSLLRYLLLMILPSSNLGGIEKESNTASDGNQTYLDLQKYIINDINELKYSYLPNVENNQQAIDLQKLLREYRLFQLHVLRYNEDWVGAKQLLEELYDEYITGLTSSFEDPRINHAAALIYYNIYLNDNDLLRQEKDSIYKKMVNYLEEACTGYKQLHESRSLLYQKAYTAVLNALAYVQLLKVTEINKYKAENNKNEIQSLLQHSIKYLAVAKLEAEDDFNKYPEYLHTEASIYYQYARFLSNDESVQWAMKSWDVIVECIRRDFWVKSNYILTNDHFYRVNSSEIDSDYILLRDDINKYLAKRGIAVELEL